MGGLYWLPACHLTRGREPYLTGLLGVGLAITLLLLGLPFGVPLPTLGAAWSACPGLLLVVRRLRGDLSHNVERFAPVHVGALMLGVLAAWLTNRDGVSAP